MKSRRDFLRHASYASAGMALLNAGARTVQAAQGTWGFQLYTVRDLIPTKPAETLKATFALGYREVEMLRGALDLMPLVKDAGLSAPGTHIEAPIVTGDWAAWTARPDAKGLPKETYTIDSASPTPRSWACVTSRWPT